MDNGDLSCLPTYASARAAAVEAISNIYPNPADEHATVELKLEKQSMVQIDVMDIAGRIVYSTSILSEEGVVRYELDTKSLEDQVYMVRVIADQKTEMKSIVVFH